jgi:NADP-dependent 3-hydroxy acid dehydrogenase YdfG
MWHALAAAASQETSMKLNDKVVLITGAGRGLGAATARAFAREGAVVIVNYLQNTQAAEQVVADCKQAGGQAWAMQADVTDAVAVQDMVSEIVLETGRIDVLVNNAFAPYRFDPDTRLRFTQLGWEACQRQFEGAVKSAWQTSQAVVPHMQRQKAGHIINVSSVAGHKVGPGYAVYAATKHAVRALSEGLRQEVKPYNIRTTVISPGAVATELPNSVTDPDAAERIRTFYAEVAIPAESFARAAAFAISQPDAVDVNEILFRPTQQEL